jgi:hypothetical protein
MISKALYGYGFRVDQSVASLTSLIIKLKKKRYEVNNSYDDYTRGEVNTRKELPYEKHHRVVPPKWVQDHPDRQAPKGMNPKEVEEAKQVRKRHEPQRGGGG